MFRMFSFLPPIGLYTLAALALAGTYYIHSSQTAAGETVDSSVYVVGGIIAFLLAFAGFQKSLAERDEAKRPRVSSDEVMKKLTPTETGIKDVGLDGPPQSLTGPTADSPLGRVRARSQSPGF